MKTLDELLRLARMLPPMTPAERDEQRLDWAYGNLACSRNHRPSRLAFYDLAKWVGWSKERFDEWAADKEWEP